MASGSLPAQALYVRGLSIKNGVSPDEGINLFRGLTKTLTDEDIRQIMVDMAHLHKDNPSAVEGASTQFRVSGNKRDAIKYNLPSTADADKVSLAVEKKELGMNQLDTALEEIWQDEDRESIVEDTKRLAAFLGLYDDRQWFMNMDENERQKMIDKGKKIYEGIEDDDTD